MKKILNIAILTVLSLILVACNKGETTSNEKTVSIAHSVSISSGNKDDKGEIIYQKQLIVESFKANPERVVTFSLGVLDMLDTVGLEKTGIVNLGLPKSNLPDTLKAYEADKYPNAGTLFEPNYDVLDIMNPELIILDGRSASLYESLKEQYPEADILDASNTTYNLYNHIDIVRNLSKIFTNVTNEFQTEMYAIVASFHNIQNLAKDSDALFLLSNGTSISTSGKTGRYGVIFNEFGFQESDPLIDSGGSHGNATGLEYITKVNPSIIFVLDRAQTIGNESGYESYLLNEPQFRETKAYKDGHVYLLDGPSWYTVTGGFKSTNQMISDIMVYINKLS